MKALAWASFWLGAGMQAYLYAVYPAILWLLARLAPRPVRKAPFTPTVSLVVPAHDEVSCIGAKLENCLALDYPSDRLEVIVASDGSTDGTDARVEEIARARAPGRVRLLALPRGGKARALDAAVAESRGEIVVFTDANSLLEERALRVLTACFADPEVGGVCGAKRYRSAAGDHTQVGEGLYWRLDQWQKRMETQSGSIFAADGTLHAVRRDLYVPVRDPAQADDIAISARVVLQGRRLVFEPEAVAWEDAPAHAASELRRKVRVTNHSLRALLGLGPALWNQGLYSFKLLSHKLLRHLSPLFLLLWLAATLVLAPTSFLATASLAAFSLFLVLALLGAAARRRPWGRSRWLTVPFYFAFVNLAALLGIASVLAGIRRARWQPRSGLDSGGS